MRKKRENGEARRFAQKPPQKDKRRQLASNRCFNRLTKLTASPMNPCTAIAESGVSWNTRRAVRVSML